MKNWIINDITYFIKEYLPMSMAVGLVFPVAFLMCLKISNRKKKIKLDGKKVKRIIVGYLLGVYVLMLLNIALLSRDPGSRRGFNHQMFAVFSKNVWAKTYAIENIILFIPLGMLLPIVTSREKSLFQCSMFSFLLSCFIEITQIITERGYCELDDILNNLIGFFIGYISIKFMIYIADKLLRRDKIFRWWQSEGE